MKSDWIYYCSLLTAAALLVLFCLVFGVGFLFPVYPAIFSMLALAPFSPVLVRIVLGQEKISVRRMSEIGFLICGFDFLLILCFLEWTKVLLVMRYWFVTPLCVLLTLAFGGTGALWFSRGKIRFAWASITVAVLLVSFALSISHIPTSRTKRLFIIAHKIKPGWSIEDARSLLHDYKSIPGSSSEGSFTWQGFSASDPDVPDSLWLRYDANSGRILAIDDDED